MLDQALMQQIAELARRHGAARLVLYGSRARGDNSERSDIDLAVYGMPQRNHAGFVLDLEDLPTLLEFDVAHINENTNAQLLNNIQKDGVLLMERKTTKLENYERALARLREGLDEYRGNPSQVVRDGVIQRFEFTAELSWKCCKEYLEEQGYTAMSSPKAVMKTAYAAGLVSDEIGWNTLLTDRNITSHIYNESDADQVFQRIAHTHTGLLEQLCAKLRA